MRQLGAKLGWRTSGYVSAAGRAEGYAGNAGEQGDHLHVVERERRPPGLVDELQGTEHDVVSQARHAQDAGGAAPQVTGEAVPEAGIASSRRQGDRLAGTDHVTRRARPGWHLGAHELPGAVPGGADGAQRSAFERQYPASRGTGSVEGGAGYGLEDWVHPFTWPRRRPVWPYAGATVAGDRL
jgi:hypothetical protein